MSPTAVDECAMQTCSGSSRRRLSHTHHATERDTTDEMRRRSSRESLMALVIEIVMLMVLLLVYETKGTSANLGCLLCLALFGDRLWSLLTGNRISMGHGHGHGAYAISIWLMGVRERPSPFSFQAVATPLSSAVVTCMAAGGFGGGGARRGRVAVSASPLPWALRSPACPNLPKLGLRRRDGHPVLERHGQGPGRV